MTQVKHILTGLLVLLAWTGCATIDDDLSDCPPTPSDNDYQLDYDLRLVTNMTTELHTELDVTADAGVLNALRDELAGIFTDFAHDVDLSFYDTQGDSLRLNHDQHVMDANQASYTLNLPKRQYMHLAAANVVDNPVVHLQDDNSCHTAKLQQVAGDTIGSHTTGLFAARLPMRVLEGVDQQFDVYLYMANCAASLVVDTIGSGIRDMKVFTTGFATAYHLADSTYTFQSSGRAPIVRATAVPVAEGGNMAFYTVNFPSADNVTRTVIETTDPFVSQEAEQSLWEYHVYATTAVGSVTETKLFVRSPLRPGQLKVTKAKCNQNGSLASDDQTVGVCVQLDWNAGGSHDHVL